MSIFKPKIKFRYVYFALALAITYMLQYSRPSLLTAFGITPYPVLALVICAAMCGSDVLGGTFGLIAGALCDVFAAPGNGYYALTYMLTGLICSLLITHLLQNNVYSALFILSGAIFLNLTLYWLIFYGFPGKGGYYGAFVGQMIYTFVCGLPLYFLTKKVMTGRKRRKVPKKRKILDA